MRGLPKLGILIGHIYHRAFASADATVIEAERDQIVPRQAVAQAAHNIIVHIATQHWVRAN